MFPTFHRLLNEFFVDQLNDEAFLTWHAKKFGIRSSKFSQYVSKWRENEFREVRGRNELTIDTQNKIYNAWFKNSIVSTDGRNGRDEVNISKRQFLQKYREIQSDLMELTEKKNERRKLVVYGPGRIATCTLKAIQEKTFRK